MGMSVGSDRINTDRSYLDDPEEDVVRCLLQAGADAEMSNVFLQTPMHAAAKNGHEGIVRCLLAAWPDLAKLFALCLLVPSSPLPTSKQHVSQQFLCSFFFGGG